MPKGRSSRWNASLLQCATDHVSDLAESFDRAVARGDPGRVDLSRALKQARQMHSMIRRQSQYARVFKKAFEAVAFVAAAARKIYSLLNNCEQVQGRIKNNYPDGDSVWLRHGNLL